MEHCEEGDRVFVVQQKTFGCTVSRVGAVAAGGGVAPRLRSRRRVS